MQSPFSIVRCSIYVYTKPEGQFFIRDNEIVIGNLFYQFSNFDPPLKRNTRPILKNLTVANLTLISVVGTTMLQHSKTGSCIETVWAVHSTEPNTTLIGIYQPNPDDAYLVYDTKKLLGID